MGKSLRKKRMTWGRAKQKLRHELMQEQAKLVDSQRRIRCLIASINERQNALKVQELQLRSNAAHAELKPNVIKNELPTPARSFDFETSAIEINGQNLDLDVMAAKFFQQFQEEYEDVATDNETTNVI